MKNSIKHMKKRTKTALILLCAVAGMALLYFAVVRPLVNHFSQGQSEPPVELLEGEAYYRYGDKVYPNMATLYENLGYADVFQVVVHNAHGEEYLFYHHQRAGQNYFLLGTYENGTYDEGATPVFYQPAAGDMYESFDYTSLYDGQGRIPAMLSAVGSILFDERVYLWDEATEDAADVERALHRYGLAEEDDAPWFEVTPYLTDKEGRYICSLVGGSGEDLYYYDPSTDAYYHVGGVTYDPQSGYAYDPAAVYVGGTDRLVPTADPSPERVRRVYVGRALPDNSGYYLRLEGRGVVYAVKTVSTPYADIDYSLLVHRDISFYVKPRLLTDASSAYDPLYTPHMAVQSGSVRAPGAALSEGDLVTFSYQSGGGRAKGLLLLSDPTDSMTERLLRASVGDTGLTLRADKGTPDTEDDILYEDVTVEGAVAWATDVSFGYYAFVGDGQKDIFLGESIYTIKSPAQLKAYGIDYSASVGVLQILSGLAGIDQAQQASTGIDWSDMETVAVGNGGRLTPELLEEYGLLSHRVTYTLPYGVTADSEGNLSYKAALTFELFISDEKEGHRYAASSLFGTVVRVDAALFDFVEWDVLGRWSRGNLLMVAASNLRSISYSTFYSDKKGTHTFWLSTDDNYTTASGTDPVSRLYVAYLAGRTRTKTYLDDTGLILPAPGRAVTVEGDRHYVTEVISEGLCNLDDIYAAAGHTGRDGVDEMGVYYFRHLLTSLYSMYYVGEAAEDLDDVAMGALLADPDACVSRMTVTLTDGRVYTYEFFVYSARRAVVRLRSFPSSAAEEAGSANSESAVFVVNTSEVNKLTSLFEALSQGVAFDEDDFY